MLEHGYLTRVERPHGLPRGLRQVPATGVDGRLGHDSTLGRDKDLERDLDAALDCEATVRLGYGQVFSRSCSTAAKMGRLFQLRGWPGAPTACPDCAQPGRRDSDQAG